MILNVEDKDQVVGEIYKITNTVNNKMYVGQTRSHRLNRGKYRPFGYLGRFRDHISESRNNKQCCSRYLNHAFRKYGIDNFTCDLIETCKVDDLDTAEQKYILDYNTKYPNGYNLTNGGKGFTDVDGNYLWDINKSIVKEYKPQLRSDYTKQLISSRLKKVLESSEHREKMMKTTQNQHYCKKFNIFKSVIIDENNIEKYVRVIDKHTDNTQYVEVSIAGKKTTFVGKYETIDEIKSRAKKFISNLIEWQRNQNAGNSLEPNTTTL
tara:strand:- start:117 stop:914 length:798 start_codon:yes stop_codon:yes gene_type:complete